MKSRALLIGLGSISALLLLGCCGGGFYWFGVLLDGVDSWRHYSSGGMFATESPSLSTEGDQIVFSTPFSGHGDIYVAEVRTGTARRLTHTNDFESSPHFLPGSKQIVFQREQVPYRHLWLLDLDSGKERQLTRGRVVDDILDVSPIGRHILISRSSNLGNGRQDTRNLLDIDSGTIKELNGTFYAVFVDRGSGLLATWQGAGEEFGLMSLDGQRDRPLGKGWIHDASDEARLTVFMHVVTPAEHPNKKLLSFNRASGESETIGLGHSATVFPNGKVLYFVGYEHDAMIFESGAEPRPIDSPAGYKVRANRTGEQNATAFFVMPPQQPDRLLNIYLFDAESERFNRVDITFPAPRNTP